MFIFPTSITFPAWNPCRLTISIAVSHEVIGLNVDIVLHHVPQQVLLQRVVQLCLVKLGVKLPALRFFCGQRQALRVGTAQSNTGTGMGHHKHWDRNGTAQTPGQEWDSTLGLHSQTPGQEWDITNTGTGVGHHKHQVKNGTAQTLGQEWDITVKHQNRNGTSQTLG